MNNIQVRTYWEREPCGTNGAVVGSIPARTREWYERIEQYRYDMEPFIHAIAQFTRYHGMRVLEIGIGAGTDHLQWARAGARCYGLDLTRAAVEVTRDHLSKYGFKTNLSVADSEELPFKSESFDVVYSWGVVHHAEHPELIVKEIRRVLKPGSVFIGMMYGRHSLVGLKLWLKHALLKGRPQRSFADVIRHHMESVGTKAYTVRELRQLFSEYRAFTAKPLITPYDTHRLPAWLSRYLPDEWGWFIAIKAVK